MQLSTLSLYLLPVSLSLTPPFFSFLGFLPSSHAAARRQEQHEQTGFLAAFIHLLETTPFLHFGDLFFCDLIHDHAFIETWPKHILFCCHRVDSHASRSCDKPPSFALMLIHNHFLFSPTCRVTSTCTVTPQSGSHV